jgi:hypothetical protein
MMNSCCCSRRYTVVGIIAVAGITSVVGISAVPGVPSVTGIAANADASLLQASPMFLLS